MKLRAFKLLTDENIDPAVVSFLRSMGFDVWDVCENGWQGKTDVELIQHSVFENRVIVTHDADFGTLVMLGGERVVGILYLRPGHIDSQFTIDTLISLLQMDPDVTPPFIVVAQRKGAQMSVRIRHLTP